MDLIKREDAINAFAAECEGPYEACMQVAVGLFRKIPSASPKVKWIPVSKRLPESTGEHYGDGGTLEESKLVLVYAKGHGKSGYGIGRYIYDRAYPYDSGWNGWFDEDLDLSYCEVLAWMPMPDPYIGG